MVTKAIFDDDKCSHCGFERVFLEMNCRTQEYLRFCPACGSLESFDYRYNKDGWIEKTVVLPLSEIALTVRVHPRKAGWMPLCGTRCFPPERIRTLSSTTCAAGMGN